MLDSIAGVQDLLLDNLSGFHVEDRHLLLSRMQSQPTRIMSSTSMSMTSSAPGSPRLSTTRCRSH